MKPAHWKGPCGASAALAVVASGAWVGRVQEAGAAAKPAALASAAAPIRVGDELIVAGRPMRLEVEVSADDPARVISFYADRFRAAGLAPLAAGQGPVGHVSAFDPAAGAQRFVTAIHQGAGSTLILRGTTTPSLAPQFTSAAATGLLLPPGARAFLGFEASDAGVRSNSGHCLTAGSPENVARFYRTELLKRGFVETPGSRSSAAFLEFHRGAAGFSVGLQALEGQAGSAVFVVSTEDGDAR